MSLFLPIAVIVSVTLLFFVLSIIGGMWIKARALSYSDTPKPRRRYKVVIPHTYSPKYRTLSGWKAAIPERGKTLMKKAEELARKRGLPIFLPVGAITVPGSKESEASIYRGYLIDNLGFKGGIIVSDNPDARDTRTCVLDMCSFVSERSAAPALVLATRAHMPRIARLLKEVGGKSDCFELVAVDCSFRYYIWEFWMYIADMGALRPGSRTRKILLNVMGRKA